MTENVVSLRGEAVRNDEREPAETVIQVLEELLADARKGDIRAVAVAYTAARAAQRDWISHSFAYGDDSGAGGDLLIATVRMKRNLENHLFADADG